MTATVDLIKEEIYDKIAEINDEKVLLAIQTLIANLEVSEINQVTDKRDLNGYIKEWVKNM
ncbi:hypothetical protein WH52_13900 [Tenacibaculum holothuriorum]|uniref:Uncharacterized protein n=1 Tax=Tenacibaculum holothuriorum TaxID=1635173 RepID=A0A1Y2PB85_9FLAO|nr:hypothetical protein [Tenacibaculum holothuriorum]OSY86988.1 hypothetical protein WH52_13900 [Tenacibaculum holothuriorum]